MLNVQSMTLERASNTGAARSRSFEWDRLFFVLSLLVFTGPLILACPFSALGQSEFPGVPRSYASGQDARDVAVGDFDEDGVLDLVVCNAQSSSSTQGHLSILLGDNNRGFEVQPGRFGPSSPFRVEVDDFNEDGHLDLLAIRINGAGLFLLTGVGDGTFVSSPLIESSLSPLDLAIGDFNEDGHLDVAVGNISQSVLLRLGDGLGGFSPALAIFAGTEANQLDVTDFNLDGHLDLLVLSGGEPIAMQGAEVATLLGDGLGGFTAPQVFEPAFAYFQSAIGDFDGDGDDDFVATLTREFFGTSSAAYFSSNGDGTFASAVEITDVANVYVTSADLDGDGILDLTLGRESASFGDTNPNVIELWYGIGNGEFIEMSVVKSISPLRIVVADLTGNGFGDLIAANGPADRISIHLAEGPSVYDPNVVSLHAHERPQGSAAGDFDGDGALDIVIFDSAVDADVFVSFGDGAGGVAATSEFEIGGFPQSAIPSDLNTDVHVDLVVSVALPAATVLLIGDGTGQFDLVPLTPLSGPTVVADFTGDGITDIVVADETLRLFQGNGDGTFAGMTPLSFLDVTVALEAGDFDEDGQLDLLATGRLFGSSQDSIVLLQGLPGGSFSSTEFLSVPRFAVDLAVEDFDDDGHLDFAFGSMGAFVDDPELITIYLGDGTGMFAGQNPFEIELAPGGLSTMDANVDGVIDLVSSDGNVGNVGISIGDGSGAFVRDVLLVAGAAASVTVADFDLDGRDDVISDGRVFLNRVPFNNFRRGDANDDASIDVADAVFLLDALFVIGASPACRDAADANDDGQVDLSDAIFVLSLLFVPASPTPALPYPDCGSDPTPDLLGCSGRSCL